MNNSNSKHSLSSLMALLLFAVFAVSILSVLLAGTQVYRRITERDAAAYAHRTAVQYLSTKVRQSDASGMVGVEDFCGTDALVLTEDLDGEVFLTRIYCHNGYLYELFSPADLEAMPEDGEQLLPLRSLDLELAQNLLRISLTEENGTPVRFHLTLRSTGEDLP